MYDDVCLFLLERKKKTVAQGAGTILTNACSKNQFH
jgi:hypothetical protein